MVDIYLPTNNEYYNFINKRKRKRKYIYNKSSIILLKIMSRTIGLRKYKRHLSDNDIYDIKINNDNNEGKCKCGEIETIDHILWSCTYYSDLKLLYNICVNDIFFVVDDETCLMDRKFICVDETSISIFDMFFICFFMHNNQQEGF